MAFDFKANIDASGFKRGGEQMADTIDNVTDAFKDLENDSERHLDNVSDALGDGIKDGAKEADTALERLEKQIKSTLNDAGDKAKRTGDDIGDGFKRGAKDAEEGLDTLNENAGSNAKEVAASFDGSFDSLADGLQGFVAESLEGFGAIGLAGGVGIALALGIGLNALNSMAEEANALTEDAVDLGDALAEAVTVDDKVQVLKDRFAEVANEIGDARSAWELWQDRARTKGEQLADAINQGTLSAEALTAAFEDPDPVRRLEALREVSDGLQRSIDTASDSFNDAAGYSCRLGAEASKTNRELTKQNDISKAAKGIIDDEIATQEAAVAILQAKATALGLTTDEYATQQAATEAATAAQEAYASALEGTADPISVYDGLLSAKEQAEREAAETTAAATQDATDSWEDFAEDVTVSVDDLIAEWNRQADAQKTFEANLAVIAAQGGQAIADELRKKGPAVAGAAADTLAKAGDAKIREAAAAYGRANGSAVGQGTAAGITSQQGAVQGSVDAVHRGIRVPNINMPVGADGSDLQRQVNLAARGVIPPTIKVQYTTGSVRPM